MPIAPVPACLVSGLTGTDQRSFVAALLRARPAGSRWALLDNDGGGSALELAQPELARGVRVAQRICAMSPQWLAALPQNALERLRRQMAAADCVVTARAEAVAALRAAGIERVVQADEAVRRIAGASTGPSASSPRIAS